MQFSFLIIDDNSTNIKGTLELFDNFPNYFCAGVIKDSQTAINQIIKVKPQLVIVQIPIKSIDSTTFFKTITESFQYLECIPYFIALASSPDYALEAIQSGFSDYIVAPLHLHELGKMLFKFEKRNPPNIATTICIKSYSDYQFVALQDITYLKADNNTTDIQMDNGKTVNAYKTLKHFESTLPFYFLRIHKSYIVNINHVSRIHFSKAKCYLNYNEILPFSLTYKDNIDAIIKKINI
ncbi:MAG TPA: LytTR family transcriptional regulator DNA-binding domain-containing protein [Flavobacterium sp.]|uniref:LytR/AlgR family response regulator transcription factor n=1 Tax=Flavobacterium sp. TaxID=239 RepID=UPI002DBC900A|nr:LytTR family transcriptional regulator DNA-binding domain-containing protein [Flavobacterium sp.]HEU4790688.1 LytTR family transcriptional regulator DNA-binding domain-containing protein [Flavobacterium sp.]